MSLLRSVAEVLAQVWLLELILRDDPEVGGLIDGDILNRCVGEDMLLFWCGRWRITPYCE